MSESFRAIVTILGPVELPGEPGNELPGTEDPVDPDYGVGHEPRPPHAGHPLPPGFFPPHKPIVPRPPGRPPVIWPPSGHADNTLPMPPPDLLPPTAGNLPVFPDQGLPPTAGNLPVFPDSPGEPGTIWPPLPGIPEGSGNLLVIVWVPTVGYRWAVIDPSLTVDNTLPSPPTAQPK